MFDNLKPNNYYKSVYDIDVQELQDHDIKSIIFDIDNAFVDNDAPIDDDTILLIGSFVTQGFDVEIISNYSETRAKAFAKALGLPCSYITRKSIIKSYVSAMKLIHADTKRTCVIGSRLFTDIYNSNKLGSYTILVDPVSKKEPLSIKIKRVFEKIILSICLKTKPPIAAGN